MEERNEARGAVEPYGAESGQQPDEIRQRNIEEKDAHPREYQIRPGTRHLFGCRAQIVDSAFQGPLEPSRDQGKPAAEKNDDENDDCVDKECREERACHAKSVKAEHCFKPGGRHGKASILTHF